MSVIHTGKAVAVLLSGICLIPVLSPAARLAAQPRIVVEPAASCAACAIRLERLAVLGGTEIPGALGVHSAVFAGLDGRYYVIDAEVASGEILVYDGSGRYQSSFGRLGQGPGEYRLPQAILARSPDTIQVMDSRLRRITTLTRDHQVVRTQALPLHFTDHALLQDGGLVVNGQVGTRDGIGFPLHRLDREMCVVRLFGTESAMELPGMGYRNVRKLAPAGGGGFWAAHLDRFVVERWDAAGNHVRDYVREADWFPPWQGMGTLARLAPPQIRVHAVQQDAAGRLWVLLHVPAHDWKPGAEPPPRTSTPLANNRERMSHSRGGMVGTVTGASGFCCARKGGW